MRSGSIRYARQIVFVGTAFFLLAVTASRAHAKFVLTLTQVGGNVVVSGSGTINTTALNLSTFGGGGASYIRPSDANLIAGPLTGNYYGYNGGGLIGPTTFGPGTFVDPSSGTGSIVGVQGQEKYIIVPYGYTSGTQLTDSVTFDNETFASLGFTPGIYTYTWGTGTNADSFTVTGGVPEPSTWLSGALLLVVTATSAVRTWQRTRPNHALQRTELALGSFLFIMPLLASLCR